MKVQIKIFVMRCFSVLVILLLSAVHANAASPIILYTDLASGPTTGGENNKGAYISIFGKNFGSSGLGTTVKCYIGNVEVDNYRYLGASKGRADIQQITVQVGALSGLNQGTAYPVKVMVGGVASNTDITFIPNPGKIIFVSLTGNDNTGSPDNIARSYRNVQTSSWPNDRSALNVAGPGDVIVMRGGTWLNRGYDNYFCKFRYKTGSAPNGSSGTGPITVMAYPGEDVYVYNTDTNGFSGGFAGVNRLNYPGDSDWITISGLRVRSDTWDGPINLQVMADHWRVVNNDLSDQTMGTAKAGGVSGNGAYTIIIGNKIHDIRGNTMENHGIYIDGGTHQPAPFVDIAYNYITDIPGGSCFQIYNVGTNGPNQSGDPVPVNNLYVHHNIMKNCGKYGVNISDGSGSNIRVYNNYIDNTVVHGLRFNATCQYDNPGEGCNALMGFRFYHNTLYNTVTGGIAYDTVGNDWGGSTSAQIDVRNNIFVPYNGRPYIGGSFGVGTFYKNIWYGSGSAPTQDSAAINLNPMFVNPSTSDFRLQYSSPAIDSGTNILNFTIGNDIELNMRPAGSASDIGAYEYSKIPSSPTQLQIR